MSGGHFDYIQYRINQAADEVEQEVINNNVVNEWNYSHNFSEETLVKFKECEIILRKAASMLQRVDYLISGDDSEESFHERWQKEVPK